MRDVAASRPAPSERHDRSFHLAVAWTVALSTVFIARGTTVVDGRLHGSLFDDAMISMRYARNLAGGDGLVWNAGEPGVEGYTNFGWTLVMAAVHALGVPPALAGVVVAGLSAACLVATLFVVRDLACEVDGGDATVAAVAVWLTALSYPLFFWALRGMEVGALALLVALCVRSTVRLVAGRPGSLGALAVWSVVALAVRTDAVVPVGACVLAIAVLVPGDRRIRPLLVTVVVVAATLAVHTALRIAWYGEALPNTYHLKVGGIPLADRLERGTLVMAARVLAGGWLPIALSAIPLVARPARLRTTLLVPVLVVTSVAAYSVWTGGDAWDWMPYPNRYLTTVAPLLATTTALGVVAVARATPALRARVALGCAVTATVALVLLLAEVVPTRPFQLATLAEHVQVRASLLTLGACIAAVLLAARVGRPGRRGVALALAGAVVVAASTAGAEGWLRHGGELVADDRTMTEIGVLVDRHAPPSTRIAVVWAGTLPYFADRPAIDAMGKTDATIGRQDPSRTASFWPGHDKWDVDHTLALEPDLVFGAWPGAPARLEALGYDRITVPGLRSDEVLWVAPWFHDEAEPLVEALRAARGTASSTAP